MKPCTASPTLRDVFVGAALAAALSGCSSPASESSVAGDEAALTSKCSITDQAALGAIARIGDVADACAAAPGPNVGQPRGFAHGEYAALAALSANHRGRDAFYAVGEAQWVLGKFAYGPLDKDLKGEPVDIHVLRGCSGQWEKLGTATTTEEAEHEPVEGVEDTGGRVYFRIPAGKELPVGRHRVRMVVAGDNSTAEQFIEVLPKGAALFVTDMDGTLTERKDADPSLACDEESDFPATLRELSSGDSEPNVHTGVAAAFHELVKLGYRPLYLTARPEWLVPHTRRFLSETHRGDGRGNLPQGNIHTTLGMVGAINSAAEAFKKSELQRLVDKGFVVGLGFGNRPSDVATYQSFEVPFRYYYENPDTRLRHCSTIADVTALPESATVPESGDFRIGSYDRLVPLFGRMGPACAAPR